MLSRGMRRRQAARPPKRGGAMEFRPILRAPDAFQKSLEADQVREICRRALGLDVLVAVELGLGMYNTTYRVEVEGPIRSVVLRVAPAPERQFRSEREL